MGEVTMTIEPKRTGGLVGIVVGLVAITGTVAAQTDPLDWFSSDVLPYLGAAVVIGIIILVFMLFFREIGTNFGDPGSMNDSKKKRNSILISLAFIMILLVIGLPWISNQIGFSLEGQGLAELVMDYVGGSA
jgi:protein-S-isoprenylcysteine O-methyltransferase Ste14